MIGYYSKKSAEYGSLLAELSNGKIAVITELVFDDEMPLSLNTDKIKVGIVTKIIEVNFDYTYDC